jgi:peptidoglycan-N-acetylglucosamine deacetylase
MTPIAFSLKERLSMYKFIYFFMICMSCVSTFKVEAHFTKVDSSLKIIKKYEELVDISRKRQIPIEISYVEDNSKSKVVVLNHGYGVTNKDYQFIANHLAALGFFVVSIQHDLKTDPKIPRTGNIFQRRKPMWERGVQNINFVLGELKRIDPNLNLEKVTLIGHSNGGDISMMFADLYPQKTAKVISIDSLRYPFPVKHSLPILTLRATDTKADKNVLPLTGAKIVEIKDAKHNHMYDAATDEVKKDMLNEISCFLK